MNILSLQGSQDKYLHFKAFHSFFTNRHVTYEPFSKEHVSVNAQGQVDYSRQATFNIPAAGELMTKLELEVTTSGITAVNGGTPKCAFVHNLAIYQIDQIECRAVNQIIDTLYPEFIDALSRVTVSASQRNCYNDLIGQTNIYPLIVGTGVAPDSISVYQPQVLQATHQQVKTLLPLPFWFTMDYSQALPISVLVFTQISFRIRFKASTDIYVLGGSANALLSQPTIIDCKLWVEYVYLDENARKRLVTDPTFFVIQQVQFPGVISVNGTTLNYKLPFVMPTFELMTFCRDTRLDNTGLVKRYDCWERLGYNPQVAPAYYMVNGVDPLSGAFIGNFVPLSPFSEIEIKYNSNKIMDKRNYLYHARLRPFYDHVSSPDSHGLWIMTHALFPDKVQASGAANLSGSDNNYINYTFDTTTPIGPLGTELGGGIGANGVTGSLFVFARNYNYIYIENGFLTLLYGS